jgi:predicted PurR-regulated permease PerM
VTTAQRFWVGAGIIITALLIYLLRPVLAPFLFAAFLAYIGDPLVNFLTRCHLSRTWAATLVFVIIMLIVLVLLLFLIPLLGRELTLFLSKLPQMLAWFQQFALPWLSQKFNFTETLDLPDLKTTLAQHWQQAGNVAATAWKVFSRSGMALLGWLAKLLIVPVVTFYLLRDWNDVISGSRELLPRRVEPGVTAVVQECNEVLGAFFRGQLLVMLGLTIIYTIGLALAGLDFALLLGSIAGLLAIVPYLGVIVGVLAASIAAIIQFHDGLHLFYVFIVFIIGHLAEHMVLTPWLVGDRIGLHPVAVIFAILAGSHLFGAMGGLLALPVAAVIMVLLRHIKQHYVQSGLYS